MEPTGETQTQPTLLRKLGTWTAISIVVGSTIGSGIFVKAGGMARDSGSFGMIISVWIFGGLLCMCGALCFAELGAMLPRAGGLYVYIREAFGKPVAFLFGMNEFVVGRPASISALSYIAVGIIAGYFGVSLPAWKQGLYTIGIIIPFALINILGVVWGGGIQTVTTLGKVLFVGFLALLPLALFFSGAEVSIDTANFATTVEPFQPTFFLQFAALMLAVMWAYNGWHDIAPVAEEVKDPSKNIPFALIAGVGLLILLYLGATLAYHSTMSMEELAVQSGKSVVGPMISKLFGENSNFGSRLLQFSILMQLYSILGAISANILLGPRIVYALGRDRVFFPVLGQVHASYRTPVVAIVTQSLIAIVMIIVISLLISFHPDFKESNPFDFLTDVVTYSASIFYSLCVFAVIKFRITNPEWERPYKTWGYPFTPAIFLIGYGFFLFIAYSAKPFETGIGLILISAGLPVYYIYKFFNGVKTTPS